MSDVQGTSRNTQLPSYAYLTPEEVNQYAEFTRKGIYDLGPAEEFWRDRHRYLQSCGYILRPRYCHGWRPSWLGTNLDPTFCEDSIILSNHNVIDAVRHQDGSLVSIKVTTRGSDEVSIASFLSSPELVKEPDNHCVPLLEVLPDPIDSTMVLMVMPYLRPFDDPEFGSIGETVDFVKQTLEGIYFLHRHRIAHRDCASANIMMDGRPLFPSGHHPVRRGYSSDAVYELSPLSRLDHPVRYYFIDFGISTHFAEGSSSSVVGRKGRDKNVPELSSDIPYDALKVDIFILGNLYNREFLRKYHGLDFLQPLIDAMTQQQPGSRPTAKVALAMLEGIRSHLHSTLLRWRLRSRAESPPERILYDTVAVVREGFYQLKRLVI